MEILGIDIGGSGIKGAPVDLERGQLLTERFRIPTPQPAVPEAVAEVVAAVARNFAWRGPIGCTFPAIIKGGVAYSAANVDAAWIGADARALFERATGCPVTVLNDADAAGLAEMTFGAGRGQRGVVLLLTFGTGIGSALFLDGKLVPNTELGHLEVRGKEAEDRASDRVREEKGWSWSKWAEKVDEYLARLEALFSPDLFIIGGGVSRDHARFVPLLRRNTPLVVAELRNEAGIMGAALAAQSLTT
jgi:polyphosphate glucokinase